MAERRGPGNEVAGAGPYLLDEWFRDDRMSWCATPTTSTHPAPTSTGSPSWWWSTTRSGTTPSPPTTPSTATWHFGAPQLEQAAEARSGTRRRRRSQLRLSDHVFNNSAPPFDDPRVRRAVVLGVDRQVLVDDRYGTGPPTQRTTSSTRTRPGSARPATCPTTTPRPPRPCSTKSRPRPAGPSGSRSTGSRTGPSAPSSCRPR